jgi:hypothetical protein
MERTHVAIVDLPPLQAEILGRRLGREPGFRLEHVAGPLATSAGALDGIDVLVTGADGASAEVVVGLLERHPRLTILSIRPDGRGSTLARLVPEVVRLGDTSPHDLVERLRQRPAGWSQVLSAGLPPVSPGHPST